MALNNIWVIAANAALLGTGMIDHSVVFMNDLWVKMHEQGQTAAAEQVYRGAIHLCAVTEGPPCKIRPKLLNNLGSLYLQQGRYAEARQYLEPAVAELRLQDRPLDLASSVANLASVFRDSGHPAEAEAGFAESLTIRETILGPDHPRTLAIVERLADVLKSEEKWELSEALFRRALKVMQAEGRRWEAMAIQNKLGLILAAEGKAKEARAMYLSALSMAESLSDSYQKEIGAVLSNLAVLLQSQRDYRSAQPLILRAIAIDEREYPAGHAQTARDLSRAGIGAAALHHYDQADAFLQRAADIAGDDLEAGVINATLAGVCLRRHDTTAAIRHYEKAARLLTTAWGPSDKRLLQVLEPYAAALRAREDYANAARIDAAATRIQVALALH